MSIRWNLLGQLYSALSGVVFSLLSTSLLRVERSGLQTQLHETGEVLATRACASNDLRSLRTLRDEKTTSLRYGTWP